MRLKTLTQLSDSVQLNTQSYLLSSSLAPSCRGFMVYTTTIAVLLLLFFPLESSIKNPSLTPHCSLKVRCLDCFLILNVASAWLSTTPKAPPASQKPVSQLMSWWLSQRFQERSFAKPNPFHAKMTQIAIQRK